ncbi:hypothetical protein DRN73_01980 [Candidatus Pacearchaeota archaeon]|nr:MAG: hypothetical protein DRN73_01980 [Candidatus Pacearchaeota archaeon]
MRRGDWIAIIAIVLVILIGLAIYFTFYFHYTCKDLSCFQAHQKQCARTLFINDEKDVTWQYLIKGKEKNNCIISSKILEVKKGDYSKQSLINKEMDCFVPLGSIVSPESDLSRCHGILKEELQNIMIQKLHSYIVENLGEISKELEKAI